MILANITTLHELCYSQEPCISSSGSLKTQKEDMTSLTLPTESLVDFFLDSILESFCLLQRSKVQPHLTVLRQRKEQRYTHKGRRCDAP